MSKATRQFYLILGLIFLGLLLLEVINGRFWLNDFKVYYGAAKAFLKEEAIYGRVFGEDTGLYKYSPVVLLFFAPAATLPYGMACVLHYAVIAVSFIMVLRLSSKMSKAYFQLPESGNLLVQILASLFLFNHLFRELHLGNVNVLLTFFCLLGFHLQERERYGLSAVFFAIAILFKPYLLLPGLPFLVTRKWKLIMYTGISLLLLEVLFLMIVGINASLILHQAWLKSMAGHSTILISFNTIAAIVHTHTAIRLPSEVLAGIALVMYLTLFFSTQRKISSTHPAHNYLLFVGLLAILPLLVVTDTEHFLFSAPLIVLLLHLIVLIKRLVYSLAAIGALLMYGANLGDVIGDDISVQFEHGGMLGIGNLALIALTTLIATAYLKQHSKKLT